MSATTRDQFMDVAERLFAERGFYGTSIAAIASELDLTKQALLHHFGSKEKLYGEVLRRISLQLNDRTEEILQSERGPAERLEELIVAQYRGQMAGVDSARLIMRELLDNEQRAAQAGNWYMKPYLALLLDTALAVGGVGRPRALALVYQLLGAAHYFAVSQPTLKMIFGQSQFDDTLGIYEEELRQLIRSRLGSLGQ